MSTPTLLDPKNDLVFKKLFVSAPDLLSDLINAIRCDETPVEVVEILNPRIEPADLAGKYIVLDILAKDANDHYYNIEMQVRQYTDWHARSIYYLAKTLADQLKSGEPYSQIKPLIGIHLLDFDLFPDPQQALWCFELRDRRQPQVKLGNELQLNIIELRKADRLHASNDRLASWIDYFEHWQEEAVMNQIAHPPVQQALEKLKALSGDEETRRLAFVRERALRDEISQIDAARREGKLEGRQEGEAKALIRMLTKRFGPLSTEIQQRIALATPEQLEAWMDKLFDAPSLTALFDGH